MNPEKTHLYKKEHQQQAAEEMPVHRKKSKTSAAPNSKRRSAHKHIYKKIILHYGSSTFAWGRQCEICGRIDSTFKASNWGGEDLKVTGEGVGNWEDICLAEIHHKYPEYSIMTLKNAQWQEWTGD